MYITSIDSYVVILSISLHNVIYFYLQFLNMKLPRWHFIAQYLSQNTKAEACYFNKKAFVLLSKTIFPSFLFV